MLGRERPVMPVLVLAARPRLDIAPRFERDTGARSRAREGPSFSLHIAYIELTTMPLVAWPCANTYAPDSARSLLALCAAHRRAEPTFDESAATFFYGSDRNLVAAPDPPTESAQQQSCVH